MGQRGPSLGRRHAVPQSSSVATRQPSPRSPRRMNYSHGLVALASALAVWSVSLLLVPSACVTNDSRRALATPRHPFLLAPPETAAPPSIMTTTTTAAIPATPPTGLAHTWLPHTLPCYPQTHRRLMSTTPATRGLLFLRPHKVGSTTMVGIVLRLMHQRSPALPRPCMHRAMHGTARSYAYAQRDPSASFLVSLLRHPTARAISQFFHFSVSTGGAVPTDAAFVDYLRHTDRQNYYLKELMTRHYTNATSTTANNNNETVEELERLFYRQAGNLTADDYNTIMDEGGANAAMLEQDWDEMLHFGNGVEHRDVVRDILDDYDFLAVTERLDESLVALQMLLNLTTREILYSARARSSGTFSFGGRARPCLYISPSFVTPGMRDFFASAEWQRSIAGDLLLYQAANESLDRTIASLGREVFARNLQVYRVALVQAAAHCRGRVHTLCTDGGVHQTNTSCYIWGEGCDHECLGDLVLDD